MTVPPVRFVLSAAVGEPTEPPELDLSQRAVVEHPGGPLLVLAGPGTGKTTTVVEAVVDRIERRGLPPDGALVLTFSRKAAEELRSRINARLGHRTGTPLATTFHAFCYGLVREFQDPADFTRPLQLLSAAEQDSRIAELLSGSVDLGTRAWPPRLSAALDTRGFAKELQTLMSRIRTLGLDPEDVAAVAVAADRPDWQTAAAFFEEYLQVFDAQNLIDYAELVHRATIIAQDPANQQRLRERFALVVVDEYQDTDRAQVALLQALAGDGRDLVVVGDPDQSVYAFRGAEVAGLLGFPLEFPATDGTPARTLALRSTRRFGQAILDASRAVIGRLPVTGPIDRSTFEVFRNPAPVDPPFGPGEVHVRTFSSPAAEAENIALALRRAHLDEAIAWGDMAVLVRSGMASIPRLQRALVAAGVPVEVAGDEVPLRSEPAVAPLLRALRLAQALADDADLDPVEVEAFLTGPLGGLDASSLRGLCQALRRAEAASDEGEHRLPRSSATLLEQALREPLTLGAARGGRTTRSAEQAHRAAMLLATARRQVIEHEAPEQILWQLWDASRWGRRLSMMVDGGGAAARAAHRDLDAVCALFDLAARAEERGQRRRLAGFLDEIESQQLPADTFSTRDVRGDAVWLLTAHRSKGLQWRVVVVAGVQADTWPDLRHRGSLLQPDRLGPDGVRFGPSVTAMLAEERRLFYVAVTRARQRLMVTAVESSADDGDQPSSFLTDLYPHATSDPRTRVRRPQRPLSLRGVVAELRAIAETTADPAVRDAAAVRLAALVGTSEVDAADPQRWWGVRDVTESKVPVRPADAPLAMSGSSLDKIVSCPLSWFLGHEAKGETASTSAQGFGLLVHALAADVLRGGSLPDATVLDARLDQVWSGLEFVAPWVSARERIEARRAIERFVVWHAAQADAGERTPLAAEHPFVVTVTIGGDDIVVRGSMDRVEIDTAGFVRVVDFKTGKNPVKAADLAVHPQLGVYQVAVEHGAADDLVGRPARAGGAELVQLRTAESARLPHLPKIQPQDPPVVDVALPAYEQLGRASVLIRGEEFVATPSPEVCRHCDFAQVCPAQPQGRSILSAPGTTITTEDVEWTGR